MVTKVQVLGLTEKDSIVTTARDGQSVRFTKESGIITFWKGSEDEYLTGDLKNPPVTVAQNKLSGLLKTI